MEGNREIGKLRNWEIGAEDGGEGNREIGN